MARKYFIISVLILFAMITIPSNLVAQDSEDDIYDMDLDSILNMEVTTVSKKAESISDAPAIITVMTAEQIRDLGVQSLTELMSYVPGFSVSDTYWKPGIVTARGVMMTLYNDKILMLINGVPAYGGAAMEHFLETVPMTAVKRLEIIRGPGSTLYGTNAFSAVINIITKDSKDAAPFGHIKYGSFDTRETGLSFGGEKNKFNYFFSANLRDDDGYNKAVTDEAGVPGEINYEKDNESFYGSLSYGDFSINSGYFHQRIGKFGPVPVFKYGNQLHNDGGRATHEKFYLNAFWSRELNEKFSAKVALHYDYVDKQSDVGLFGYNVYQNALGLIDTTVAPDYYRFAGKVYQGEFQLSYAHSDNLNFIAGATGETREVTHLASLFTDIDGDELFQGSTEELPFNISDYGAFLQFDGGAGPFGYVGGLRYTYLGISEEGYLTPRAGLVYRAHENTSIKLLYGEAFRGAGPQEQYYKVPAIIYGGAGVDNNLEPEKIKTYEIALDQTILKKHNIRVNGFFLQVYDLIGRRAPTTEEASIVGSAKVYDNLGDQELQGMELELSGYPSKYINYFANFSYKTGTDMETDEDIEFIEKYTANAGFTWKPVGCLHISPNFQYVGEREGTNVVGDAITVDSFFLLNLQARFRINDGVWLSLVGRNITDKQYAYPELVRRNDSGLATDEGGLMTIPGGPGASFFASLSFGW